jgi:hypothetical protein
MDGERLKWTEAEPRPGERPVCTTACRRFATVGGRKSECGPELFRRWEKPMPFRRLQTGGTLLEESALPRTGLARQITFAAEERVERDGKAQRRSRQPQSACMRAKGVLGSQADQTGEGSADKSHQGPELVEEPRGRRHPNDVRRYPVLVHVAPTEETATHLRKNFPSSALHGRAGSRHVAHSAPACSSHASKN